MASIRLEHVDMTYPGGHVALRDLTLDAADGELLVLVGPSGCGKTTTLRLVAGLETPTRGKVYLDGKDETATPPHRRDVAMVFQNFPLYPNMTVRRNLEFPLRMQRLPRAERDLRVSEAAKLLGIDLLLDRMPAQLSGGEMQRVALGRCVVRRPRIFLLDEPLSNLDAQLRQKMRIELARLHRQLATTVLYVTHDQEEALTLGQRVAVLRNGELQQVAPPRELYQRPANAFVAGFIGSPPMNLLPCTCARDENGLQVTSPFFPLKLNVLGRIEVIPAEVLLGIRPQDIRIVSKDNATVLAQVELIQFRGSEQVLSVNLAAEAQIQPMTVVAPAQEPVGVGERLGLSFPSDLLQVFDAATCQRLDLAK